jgi:thiol-disulfide isomerase/thioredoxin
MKKLFSLAVVISCFISRGFAQTDSANMPPYLRFPTVPPIKILKVDSTTYFTKDNMKKNKATIIIIFNPGCEHCKHETEQIIKNIDDFKDVQIVMTTPQSFAEMKDFYKNYNLGKYPNIVVGRDEHFTMPTFYSIRSLPFLAFYNKKQKLISVHEGNMPVPKMIEEMNKD